MLVAVVAVGYQKPAALEQLNSSAISNSAIVQTTTPAKAPSVDEIVATNVAAGLSEQANLPIAPTIANQAVSLTAQSELAQTNDTVITKPQIVQPTSGNRALQTYTAQAGDTVDKVANQYHISADTVRWANNLTSDALTPGSQLVILPVDGIQYTVKDGDTVQSLATRFNTSQARIVSYNDLELSNPTVGQKLIIPGGILPTEQRPGYVAPHPRSYGYSSGSYGVDVSMARASAGNRYAPGYCTWYAYEKRVQLGLPVGSFWGNANTWASYARAAGLQVDSTPTPGAILQTTAGGYGHVGIIESVDWGSGMLTYSDMNGIAGFDRVGRATIPISQAQAQWVFIH